MAAGPTFLTVKLRKVTTDLADFLAEPIDNTFLAQTELVHAETNNNGDEHYTQHCVIHAHSGTNVAGNNVQNDQQGIGTGCSGACGHTLDMDIEQTGLVEDHGDGTGCN